MKSKLKNFFLLTASTLVMAVGIYFFKFANNFTFGGITGDDKYIILTVLSPSQAVRLRNFIKEHEPGAFLLISNTSEIIGKGFHSV